MNTITPLEQYKENHSPDGEKIQYMMEHPELQNSPLEQFNEEVMKEFKKLFISEEIAEDVPGFDPIEYDYEWSGEPIDALNFITQKLTEHKELILKMVRETIKTYYLEDNKLYNAMIDKILNNLDTI